MHLAVIVVAVVLAVVPNIAGVPMVLYMVVRNAMPPIWGSAPH
jgi:hypothetical protein